MGIIKDLISLNLLLLFVFLIAVIEAVPWLIPLLLCLAFLRWVIWPCLRAIKNGLSDGWQRGTHSIRDSIAQARANGTEEKTPTLDEPDFIQKEVSKMNKKYGWD